MKDMKGKLIIYFCSYKNSHYIIFGRGKECKAVDDNDDDDADDEAVSYTHLAPSCNNAFVYLVLFVLELLLGIGYFIFYFCLFIYYFSLVLFSNFRPLKLVANL